MDQSSENSKATTAGSIAVVALAVFSVALRFYARTHIKAGIAWDDWWILVSLLLTILSGGLLLYSIKSDPNSEDLMDRDSPTFDYTPHIVYLQISLVAAILYFAVVTAIKISILLFYRRIFTTAHFRLWSLLVGIAVVMWWFAGTLTTIVSCIPVHRLWVGPSAGGSCINFNIFWIAMGILELVIDTIVLILPMGMVLRLQLSHKQKILLGGIFLLGIFVVATGVLRVAYGYNPGGERVAFTKAKLWSGIHVGVAIICACLPALRPLFTRTSARTSSSWRRRYFNSSNSGSDRDLKSEPVSTNAVLKLKSQAPNRDMRDPYSDTTELTKI